MLHWQGDFTVQRYRAALAHRQQIPVALKPDYTDEYHWDRGGVCEVPYSTSELPPPPRTNNRYPTLLEHNPWDSAVTSKNALRLPQIPSPTKTLKKSQSVVQLQSPFIGKFGIATVYEAPERMNARRQKDASAKFENVDLNPKQLLATKKLWREASTGDCYFKSGADEIVGINAAIRDGGSLNWKAPDCAGMSLFARACFNNEFDLVKYLWQFQPDVSTIDYMGRNVLHHCSRQGAAQVLTFLLRNMEPKQMAPLIIARDEKGNAPLHLAAESGSLIIAELLLKARNKDLITLQNNEGRIPFDVARRNKMHHMLTFLDPLEYVKDKTSLIARVQAKLSGGDGEGDAGGGDDDDEDDEDEEDGEGGGEKSKFKNLLGMDRRCNQERAAVVNDTKGKKGGKKGKKKKKK